MSFDTTGKSDAAMGWTATDLVFGGTAGDVVTIANVTAHAAANGTFRITVVDSSGATVVPQQA